MKKLLKISFMSVLVFVVLGTMNVFAQNTQQLPSSVKGLSNKTVKQLSALDDWCGTKPPHTFLDKPPTVPVDDECGTPPKLLPLPPKTLLLKNSVGKHVKGGADIGVGYNINGR